MCFYIYVCVKVVVLMMVFLDAKGNTSEILLGIQCFLFCVACNINPQTWASVTFKIFYVVNCDLFEVLQSTHTYTNHHRTKHNVKKKIDKQMTPERQLVEAAKNGSLDILNQLLNDGVSVNYKNKDEQVFNTSLPAPFHLCKKKKKVLGFPPVLLFFFCCWNCFSIFLPLHPNRCSTKKT